MAAPKVKMNLSGLEDMIARLKKANANIDAVIEEAIAVSVKPIAEDMVKWAEKHEITGAVLKGVEVGSVKNSGGVIYVEVGIDVSGDMTKNPNAWHAVFVEYGTPTTTADPGIRNAFKKNRGKVSRIQKEVINRNGGLL